MLRTKKTFRALAMLTALVMAFSLTSVVAFADAATTVTLTAEVIDEAVGKISAEGTISVADADVTILALRDSAEITAETLGTMDDETLASKIVYINQEAATEGAYAFSFVPKAGVPGGKVTIFVGGEGVDAPQSTVVDVTPNGPALTVADAELIIGDALEITLGGLEAEDEAAWWAAVTSITVGETTVEKAAVTYEAGSITVPGLAADEYENITIAATDFNASVYEGTITVSLKDAPTAAATADEYVWGTDAVVVNLTGATEGWYDAVTVEATAGTVTVDEAGNTITIAADDAETQPVKDGETEITISFTGAEEYKAVADVVVTVVSPLKVASESYTAIVENKKADVDLLTYTYTIPNNYTDENGVSVAYTTTGLEEAASAPGEGVTVYTVNRDAENEQTVTVTITLTHESYTDDSIAITKTYTVKIIGDDGPTVEAEDVVIEGAMEGEGADPAYGIDGATVIAIPIEEGDIIREEESIKIGDVILSYSAERNKYVGVVTGYTSVEEIIDAIEVVDEPTPIINYGKASNPASNAAITLMDVMKALALYNAADDTATAEHYMAADVLGVGEIRLTTVMAILRVYNDPTAAAEAFTVYSK